jgi:hypothetical protein
MRLLILPVLIFALTACNGGGGGSSAPKKAPVVETKVPNASLFSEWKPTDNDIELDLRGFNYDVPGNVIIGACEVDLTFVDKPDTEDYDFLGITYANSTWDGFTGSSDPGCASLNGSWLGSIEGNHFEMCSPPDYDYCVNFTI